MTYLLSWTTSQERKHQSEEFKAGSWVSWFFLPSVSSVKMIRISNRYFFLHFTDLKKIASRNKQIQILHQATWLCIATKSGDLQKTRLEWFSLTGKKPHQGTYSDHVLQHLNS